MDGNSTQKFSKKLIIIVLSGCVLFSAFTPFTD